MVRSNKNIERLIDALEIREKQLNAEILDYGHSLYPLTPIHHRKDIVTSIAVLRNLIGDIDSESSDIRVETLLKLLPTSSDLPIDNP